MEETFSKTLGDLCSRLLFDAYAIYLCFYEKLFVSIIITTFIYLEYIELSVLFYKKIYSNALMSQLPLELSEQELVKDCSRLKIDDASSRPQGFSTVPDGVGEQKWKTVSFITNKFEEKRGFLFQDISGFPYFEEVFKFFSNHFKVRTFRAMYLGAGQKVYPHAAKKDGSNIVRLHIPVITHPEVKFHIGDKILTGNDLRPGTVWYFNRHIQHAVYNDSDIDRIHLTLDFDKNRYIANLMKKSENFFKVS